MVKRLSLGLLVAVVAILADQAMKFWMIDLLTDPPRVIRVAPFFNLVLVSNEGISFGMFETHPEILVIIALVIVAALVYWLAKAQGAMASVALGLIIGGALGNVIDRLRLGAVIDFLDFHWGRLHWPAFNIADSLIFVGVVYLVAESLFARRATPDKVKGT
jgi:signal peptidase II